MISAFCPEVPNTGNEVEPTGIYIWTSSVVDAHLQVLLFVQLEAIM